MIFKSRVCPAGLLLLVLLRQAHTRLSHSRARKLPIGPWRTASWKKEIVNVGHSKTSPA
jgi:hypothetical protein